MSTHTEDQQRAVADHGLIRVNFRRVLLGAVLVGGLFALLFLVLLPRGGNDGSVLKARMVDTPPGSLEVSPGVRPGQLARDFEASNLQAKRFRLSDFRGQPVVINFWASWCTSCLAELPVLEEQRTAHQADQLAIVAVNVGESADAARAFIDALGLSELNVAMDTDTTVADAYGVRGLPHSVFIDSAGVIRASYIGQLDDETMGSYVRAAIDAVQGGEAPERLRFLTTIPREHVLEVITEGRGPGEVLFVSRRFRCDDAYCAAPVTDRLADLTGVLDVDLRSDARQPALAAIFDPDVMDRDELVAAVVEALGELPDPLYTRELEVRFSDR